MHIYKKNSVSSSSFISILKSNIFNVSLVNKPWEPTNVSSCFTGNALDTILLLGAHYASWRSLTTAMTWKEEKKEYLKKWRGRGGRWGLIGRKDNMLIVCLTWIIHVFHHLNVGKHLHNRWTKPMLVWRTREYIWISWAICAGNINCSFLWRIKVLFSLKVFQIIKQYRLSKIYHEF